MKKIGYLYINEIVDEVKELMEGLDEDGTISSFSIALHILKIAELRKINDNLGALLDKEFYEIKEDPEDYYL